MAPAGCVKFQCPYLTRYTHHKVGDMNGLCDWFDWLHLADSECCPHAEMLHLGLAT